MTLNEAIEKREVLVAEQRNLNLAKRVLNSDTIPKNSGIDAALNSYDERLKKIDEELIELSAQIQMGEKPENPEDDKRWTIEFDFAGTKTYPTSHTMMFCENCGKEDVLKWNSEDEAKAFASWYAGKYAWKIIPIDSLDEK